MRNSLLPLVAAVLLFGAGLLLIRPNVVRGQGGPQIEPGILSLPMRRPIRTESAPLGGSTAARLTAGVRDDGRWRVVVVGGADNEDATRAAMLALGEILFRADCVVVMDPLRTSSDPAPPMPLPADRVIRIATRSAAGTGDLAGDWTAELTLDMWQPRLPEGHPGAAWQPLVEGLPLRCSVEHHGRPTAAAGWPERWAATGRAIAEAALAAMGPPGGPHPPTGSAPADWGSILPMPPQPETVRWAACFQHDLVRGWSGAVIGRSLPGKNGSSESALEPLLRQVKSGQWKTEADAGPWKVWSRPKDGITQWFAVRPNPDGWDTTMWIERPAAADLVRGWIRDAASDPAAHASAKRAVLTPAVPEDLRRQAAALR